MCTRTCLLEVTSYLLAINQILFGILLIRGIELTHNLLGFLMINLAMLLFLGLTKNRPKMVLSFIIMEVVFLLLLTGGAIYLFVGHVQGVSRYKPPVSYFTPWIIIFTIIFIVWIFLGTVGFYYREMGRTMHGRGRNYENVNHFGMGPEAEPMTVRYRS